MREERQGAVLSRGLVPDLEGQTRQRLSGRLPLSRHRASERLRFQEVLPLPVWEPRVLEGVWVFPV